VSINNPSLSAPDRAQAEAILREAPFAYVAAVERSGPAEPAPAGAAPAAARPYVVPMNFAYEPATAPGEAPSEAPGDDAPDLGRLYLHTGEGRKSAALTGNPRVCIAIAADAAFNQGATPCDDGFAFRSVLVEGRATLLEDRAERERALRAVVMKHDPEAAEMPFAEETLAATLVYAVSIEALSYKTRPRRGTR
jgi:nitroimidazol reductase NimA-like FMN-containing flavoprotein (pyridoxamine 5'-phosphate oxidase superfamily)